MTKNVKKKLTTSTFWLPVADMRDNKAMRDFALGFSMLLLVFFCGLLPWLFNNSIPLWPVFVSAYLLVFAFVYTPLVYPVYRFWMVIASIVGWLNTRIFMFIAFYGMILPLGLVLRALGKLQYHSGPIRRKNAVSYWHRRAQSPTKDNLKEPF